MLKHATVVKLPVACLRQLPHPYPEDESTPVDGCVYYHALCDVQHLPDNISLKPNLREQNLGTNVAKRIRAGLLEADGARGFFHLANRGIVISASQAVFDNRKGELTLALPNEEIHGILDGAHTYRIVLENRGNLSARQYVRLEVIAGVPEDTLHYIAQARNTSVQVSNAAIMNHEKAFEIIRDALALQEYSTNIRYMDNEDGDVDIRDIICMMTPFNRRICRPGSSSQPTFSYAGKERCLQEYKLEFEEDFRHPGGYQHVARLLPDILELHDTIHLLMPEMYNKYGGGGHGGIYGQRREIDYREPKPHYDLHFLGKKTAYGTPKGLVYPILAAHRILLVLDPSSGELTWHRSIGSPIEFFKAVGHELVVTVMDQSGQVGGNAQTVGKSAPIWQAVLNAALVQMLTRFNATPDFGA